MGVANLLCRCLLVWWNIVTNCAAINYGVIASFSLAKLSINVHHSIRGFLMVFYLSYYEVYYGSHMGQETIPICSGLVQVTIVQFIAALKC